MHEKVLVLTFGRRIALVHTPCLSVLKILWVCVITSVLMMMPLEFVQFSQSSFLPVQFDVSEADMSPTEGDSHDGKPISLHFFVKASC